SVRGKDINKNAKIQFELERIVDSKKIRFKCKLRTLYLVEWKGYPDPESHTWQSATSLSDCHEAIRDFENTRAQKLCVKLDNGECSCGETSCDGKPVPFVSYECSSNDPRFKADDQSGAGIARRHRAC